MFVKQEGHKPRESKKQKAGRKQGEQIYIEARGILHTSMKSNKDNHRLL